ncbi:MULTISPECIES: NADPH-dependent oxidoreductase [Sporolactobacillus]|uniref:FMN reductase (NADPH) n=1 Tax=Sporolactobacillus nakayamae TaxID=269670 RepID=A0A1I2TMN7_9BACL|nr:MULTISPECIES: NADPH-dependent oxidoreductase [Sporolactobacillus]MCQ2010209.1 NADPH-dependent oxidoreductase [Sporolactobacillus sp. STSJ-5]SFG66170.1 FMN reductase (NADPH) [Sporolactobacillus nakayamae]
MNETLKTLLNHRSIRSFTKQHIPQEQVNLLISAAQHAATSNFFQQYSIIGVTDPEKKKALAEIGNQHYIAEADRLFVLVIDMHRNAKIAEAKEQPTDVLSSTDFFFRAFSDTVIAAQNIVAAAESLGLGTVYLGSILNDPQAVIDLLKLPKFTFPAFGIAIGYPDQSPQLKPRLPKEAVYFENEYQSPQHPLEELENYDHDVNQYYDLRDANRRVDTFTNQIAKAVSGKQSEAKKRMLETLRSQGLVKY